MMKQVDTINTIDDNTINTIDDNTELKIKRKIGEGVYGKIYETNDNTIIKYFKYPYEESTIREISILSSLKHPNIVDIKKYRIIKNNSKKNFILVMEKAKCDLRDIYKTITEEQRPYIIWQLLNAIKYIHSFNISHRDIKPSNILIFNDIDIKLCDFGLAKPGFLSKKIHSKDVVSIWYRPPEILLDEGNYDKSIDIWCIGAIMLELICKKNFPLMEDEEPGLLLKIFELLGTPNEDTYKNVTNTKKWDPFFPLHDGSIDNILNTYNVSENEKCLLKKMLTWKPNRITAEDALNHPFFDKTRSYLLEHYSKIEKRIIKTNKKNIIETYNNFHYCKTLLFSWLWEVKNDYKMTNSTLLTTYYLITEYFCYNSIKKEDLQLIGISCLMVSTYFLEDRILKPKKANYITDYTYTPRDIFIQFIEILQFFKFKIIDYIIEDDESFFNLLCCIIAIDTDRTWKYDFYKKITTSIMDNIETLEVKNVLQGIYDMPDDKLKQMTLKCLSKKK